MAAPRAPRNENWKPQPREPRGPFEPTVRLMPREKEERGRKKRKNNSLVFGVLPGFGFAICGKSTVPPIGGPLSDLLPLLAQKPCNTDPVLFSARSPCVLEPYTSCKPECEMNSSATKRLPETEKASKSEPPIAQLQPPEATKSAEKHGFGHGLFTRLNFRGGPPDHRGGRQEIPWTKSNSHPRNQG